MSPTWKVYNLISIAMNLNLPMVTTYDGLVDKTNYQIRIALHFPHSIDSNFRM